MNIYKESISENGISVITAENPSSDIVSLVFCFRAGSRHDSPGQKGYAHFLEHMIMKGSVKYPSVAAISDLTDPLGAYLNAYTSVESLRLIFQVPKNGFKKIFGLIADLVINPVFEDKTLENEKKVVLQEIGRAMSDPQKLVWIKSFENAFSGSSFANYPLGKKEDIIEASSDDLKEYMKRWMTPERSVLVVSGNISHEEVLSLTGKFYGRWDPKGFSDEPEKIDLKPGSYHFDFPAEQNHIDISGLYELPDIKEWAALNVALVILAKGRDSILVNLLRQKMGLVYSVIADAALYKGYFIYRIGTSTDFREQVIKLILKEIKDLPKKIDGVVVKKAKEQFANNLVRDISDPIKEITFIYNYWLGYGRFIKPGDIIKAVRSLKPDDVRRAAEKYFRPKDIAITSVGRKGK